jgi:hypothetical protein
MSPMGPTGSPLSSTLQGRGNAMNTIQVPYKYRTSTVQAPDKYPTSYPTSTLQVTQQVPYKYHPIAPTPPMWYSYHVSDRSAPTHGFPNVQSARSERTDGVRLGQSLPSATYFRAPFVDAERSGHRSGRRTVPSEALAMRFDDLFRRAERAATWYELFIGGFGA